MKSVTNKAIINYLLGKPAPHSEDDFLAECFSSDETAERFEMVRDALIESYLRGDLPAEDRKQFENHFLSDPQNLELIDFSKKLRGHLAENKQLEVAARVKTKKKFFSSGKLIAAGAAFATLLLGFLLWQSVLNNLNENGAPSARQINPAQQERIDAPTVSVTDSTPPIVEKTIESSPTPVAIPKRIPKINIPVKLPKISLRTVLPFALRAVAKSDAPEEVLKINKQIRQVELKTADPSEEFKDSEFTSYRVKIQKGVEKPVFDKTYKPLPSGGKGKIAVRVPARKFRNSKYRFIISGIDKNGKEQDLEATERFFNVKREK